MSRFRSTFKKSALDQDDRKQGRVNLMARNRKEKRGYSFAAQRNIADQEDEFNDIIDDPLASNNENKFFQQGRKGEEKKPKDSVKARFEKWKEEKLKQKLKEHQLKSKSRLPFKAGAVHHPNKPLEIAPLYPIKNPFSNIKSTICMSVTKANNFTAFQPFGKFQTNPLSSFPTFGSQHEAQKNQITKKQAKVAEIKAFKTIGQKSQSTRFNTTVGNQTEMQSTDSSVQTQEDNVKSAAHSALANEWSNHSRVTRGNVRAAINISDVRSKVQAASQTPRAIENIQTSKKNSAARGNAETITRTPGTRGIMRGKPQTPGARGNTQAIIHTPGTRGMIRGKPQTPGARGNAQAITHTPGTRGIMRGKPQTPGARGNAETITHTPGTRRITRGKPQTPGASRGNTQAITHTPGTKGMIREKPQTPGNKLAGTPSARGNTRVITTSAKKNGYAARQTRGNKQANVATNAAVHQSALKSEPRANMEEVVSQSYSLHSQNNLETTLPVETSTGTIEKITRRSKRKSSVQQQSSAGLAEPKESLDIEDTQMVTDCEKEETHDCLYFRCILASTIDSLEARCVMWEQEQEKCGDAMTEIAHEQLLLATGMSRLLIREKFAQFRGLIDNCESASSETTTLCSDLQGFWDMIYLQVGDIDKKFKELEMLKKNNWVPVIQKTAAKIPKKKATVTKPRPAAAQKGPSKFRAFMAAARKNKETTESSSEVEMKTASVIEVKSSKNSPAVRQSIPRSSLSTPLKKIESPNVAAIWSASRIAKSAGKKSFPLDSSDKVNPPSASKTGSSKSSKTNSAVSVTPRRGILKKEEILSGATKKNVLFTASIPEEKEEDQDTHLMPVTRTYSHHQYSVSPVKDKFDALFVSSPLVARKPSLLYTPPGQENSQANQISENSTPQSDLFDIPEETSPKFVKHPTPYITKRKERKSHQNGNKGTSVLDSTNLMLLDSPVSAGRRARKSATTTNGLSATSSVTPDLISWDSPNPGDTPKRRRSSRIAKN